MSFDNGGKLLLFYTYVADQNLNCGFCTDVAVNSTGFTSDLFLPQPLPKQTQTVAATEAENGSAFWPMQFGHPNWNADTASYTTRHPMMAPVMFLKCDSPCCTSFQEGFVAGLNLV